MSDVTQTYGRGLMTMAYRRLAVWDKIFAENPTHENNQRLIAAQRLYYAERSHHARAVYSVPVAMVNRARGIVQRALSNRARLRDDPHWQDIVKHQMIRARIVRSHVEAIASTMEPDTLPTKHANIKHTKPPTIRIKSPITGRYIYVDREAYEAAKRQAWLES